MIFFFIGTYFGEQLVYVTYTPQRPQLWAFSHTRTLDFELLLLKRLSLHFISTGLHLVRMTLIYLFLKSQITCPLYRLYQIDEELDLERERTYLAALPADGTKPPSDLYRDPNASLTPGWDEDDEDMLTETEEELLAKRTKEILQAVRTFCPVAFFLACPLFCSFCFC